MNVWWPITGLWLIATILEWRSESDRTGFTLAFATLTLVFLTCALTGV